MISIHSIYTGQPQTYTSERGTWQSSIFRAPVEGPIELGERGLAGDQVSDTKNHGSPSQAVCCHPLEHYVFWNRSYGMSLQAGNVGENWTLAGAAEDEICINDVYRVGTARVRVSGPRVPCFKQAYRVQREDWVDLTIKELRTGFYLWVEKPGVVQAGDTWALEARSHPDASIQALNRCVYQKFDPALAQQLLTIPDLNPYWQRKLRAGIQP
ncbi:MAG: MOSC domain-containing protein [Caldilineaceae bacterium]|nr:MOSC domain-containing protein [Caldilineaceae bacterium]MCB0189862.1 MOSC domain-containing protein [Caldilineaceae bacterium]